MSKTGFQVTPERVAAQANEMAQEIREIEKVLSRFQERIKGTGSYWTGRGGDTHRNISLQFQAAARESLVRLHTQPGALSAAGGIYQATEKEAKEVSEYAGKGKH